MFVNVKLCDTLRRFSNTSDRGLWQGQVNRDCNISELIKLIGTNEREVAFAARNNKKIAFDEILVEGDSITLVTNINGG